ncbi:MAG: hypothetical protein AAGK23_04605 [Pseudomonadota bacterium]
MGTLLKTLVLSGLFVLTCSGYGSAQMDWLYIGGPSPTDGFANHESKQSLDDPYRRVRIAYVPTRREIQRLEAAYIGQLSISDPAMAVSIGSLYEQLGYREIVKKRTEAILNQVGLTTSDVGDVVAFFLTRSSQVRSGDLALPDENEILVIRRQVVRDFLAPAGVLDMSAQERFEYAYPYLVSLGTQSLILSANAGALDGDQALRADFVNDNDLIASAVLGLDLSQIQITDGELARTSN